MLSLNAVQIIAMMMTIYDDDGDDDGYLWKLTLPSLHIVLVTWRHLISNDYETEIKDRRLFLLLTPPLKYAWVINSLPLAVT